MDKIGFLWFVMMIGLAFIAFYNAFFDVPAYVALTRTLALGGFMLLCISLMIGPLAVVSPKDFAVLISQRGAMGLASFVLIFAHAAVSFLLQYAADVSAVLASPSMPFALSALAILTVLALTSSNWAIKNLAAWKNIQRLVYIAFILSFVHFVIKANGLFVAVGNAMFVNVSEILVLALGVVTVLVQLWGFVTVVQRKREGMKSLR